MVGPSFAEEYERRRRRRSFLAANEPNLKGLQFVAVGAYASLLAVPEIGVWPLAEFWRPFAAVALFVLCYAAWWREGRYYAEQGLVLDRRDASGRRSHSAVWAALALLLAVLTFFGALAGMAVGAAGLAVAIWLLAHRIVTGALWEHYAFYAVFLVPASVLPAQLGLADPAYLGATVLGLAGLSLVATGLFDHRLFLRIRRGEG